MNEQNGLLTSGTMYVIEYCICFYCCVTMRWMKYILHLYLYMIPKTADNLHKLSSNSVSVIVH